MAPKLKLFLIFLAVMAIVSVFSFFDVLSGVRSANLHEGVVPLLPIEEDADQDGLADKDESSWDTDITNPDTDGDGFLDGEEVASGRDPREPAGDDDLGSTVFGSIYDTPIEEVNITDITNDLLAGAISDGTFNRDASIDKKEEALNVLSLSALESFYGAKQPVLPPMEIIANTKESEEKYLNSFAEIIKDDLLNFPNKLNFSLAINDQMSYFKARADRYKASLTKASALQVPTNWSDTHKNVIGILSRLTSTYANIANFEIDAMKAAISLNEINNINLEIKALTKSTQVRIASSDLKLDNDVFLILETLLRD